MLKRTAVFYRGLFTMSLFVLAGMWGATQYVAYKYNYHPALGEPLFSVGAHKFYAPVMWFVWIFQFAEPSEPIFDTAYMIMTASTTAGFFVFITAVTMKRKQPSGKFGTARWATSRELEPLKGHSGVVIGWSGDRRDRHGQIPRYICHGGPEHVALIAPSRSGKGASTIVPTLFRWTDSAFVLDVKGENWLATSGWRSRFSASFRFDPASADSAKFNPLQEIRLGHHAVSDADLIASMLVDPDGTKLNPSYWDQAARIFLKIVILHLRHVDPDASLARVKVWLNRPGVPMQEKLAEMATTRHLGDHVHPVIAEGVQTLNDKYFPEFSSILSTARSYLAIYDDTMLAENTSSSDFTIDMLMNAERPVSVYVVFTPSNVQRLRFFLRLFVSLVVRKLTDVNVEAGAIPHQRRCLFLLDEFPRLGNLSLLHDAIGYLAGYGIKCLIVAQSVKDLYRIYGRDQTIIENCAVRVFHATNDPDTGEYVSRLAGTATHREQEVNVSGHRLAPILTHAFVSEQETSRPLLTAGEVQALPLKDQLLFAPGMPPARLKKLEWWKDRFLSAHHSAAAPAVPHSHEAPVNEWRAFAVTAAEPPPEAFGEEADEDAARPDADRGVLVLGQTDAADPNFAPEDDEARDDRDSDRAASKTRVVENGHHDLFRI